MGLRQRLQLVVARAGDPPAPQSRFGPSLVGALQQVQEAEVGDLALHEVLGGDQQRHVRQAEVCASDGSFTPTGQGAVAAQRALLGDGGEAGAPEGQVDVSDGVGQHGDGVQQHTTQVPWSEGVPWRMGGYGKRVGLTATAPPPARRTPPRGQCGARRSSTS